MLLRHDLPDGRWHYDWLIEDRAAQQLRSFRVVIDPCGASEAFEAVATLHHRVAYLDYEGPVSGGRGVVLRLWRRVIAASFLGRGFVRVTICEGDRGWQLHGREVGGEKWTFRLVRAERV